MLSSAYDSRFSPGLGNMVISAGAPLPGKKGRRCRRELIRIEPAA